MAHEPLKFDLMYYVKAAAAGGLCCSVTHGSVCPIDVVKTRMQLDPVKYNKGMISAFRQVVSEGGVGILATGAYLTLLPPLVLPDLKFVICNAVCTNISLTPCA